MSYRGIIYTIVGRVHTWSIFTTRRYTNAVHAIVVYLSVRLFVCVCHTPVLCKNG